MMERPMRMTMTPQKTADEKKLIERIIYDL
jgi:hypothetical protein